MKRWGGICLSFFALLPLSGCGAGTPGGSGSDSVAAAITTQPTNQTVTAGQPATFTVVATGTAPLSYQWQNAATGTNISGATSASYTISSTTLAESGSTFRVVVSNGVNPPATSNTVTLTVNAAAVAPSITSQPTNQTVTAGQTATFSVTATGTAPLSYQWQSMPGATNITGATSSSYSILNTTTAESGMQFQVVVSNGINPPATSNTVALTVNPAPPPSNITVLTYHNDNSRTGQNLNETILTTANVASAQFGMLGTVTVDGPVDAEPLYVGGMTINGTAHNVLFVVTESDSVYAFDADTFAQLWHNAVLTGTGESPSDDHGCSQVEPTIGITSTPVIDLNAGPNGTIFVVAMSKDGSGNYYQRLHALDLTTGNDLMAPATIAATAPGTGTGSSGGTQTFDPASYEERAALLLSNGVIYTTWTSHCDSPPYNSWVIAYNESNLTQTAALDLTANGATQGGKEGGIWMSGDGPAADSNGFVYLLVGNGTFDLTLSNGFPNQQDFGNCFVKLMMTLSPNGNTLAVADYFGSNIGNNSPEQLSTEDLDQGSGGELLLPDLTDNQGETHHLAVGAGKDANMYIVDRDNMGELTTNNTGIYQQLVAALGGGIWSAPAYFNNTIYYGPKGDNLLAFPISQAKVATSASSTSPETFGYPGATPSVSANGSTDGIVWAVQNGGGSNTLRAYDATNLANELFSGPFSGSSSTKFVTPMIANGKVYVGAGSPDANTPGVVYVFGLASQGTQLIKKRIPRDHRRSLAQPKPPHPGSSTPGF